MMGIGNELVEPQLTSGQSLSGEMISKIFTQRTVWLLPCESLMDCNGDEVKVIKRHWLVVFLGP